MPTEPQTLDAGPATVPSIRAVAARAGVSAATVSRVLNGSSAVIAETRERVQRVIAELGYQPNRLASNLRASASGLILVTVPSLHNPFYGRVVEGLAQVIQHEGYHMLLCETSRDALTDANHLRLIQRRQVEGAICLDPVTVHRAIAEQMHGLPWLALCEFDPRMGVPFVGIDNVRAARDVVMHLVSRGHERIAMLGYDSRFMFARQRAEGFDQGLRDAGLSPDAARKVLVPGMDFADGAAALRDLWALPRDRRPTALFAVSDTLAIGALRQAREDGLRVPEDIAIVGFDDIDFASQTFPPLTTVRQPAAEMGRQAAQSLIRRLRGETAQIENLTLDHRLVIRGST